MKTILTILFKIILFVVVIVGTLCGAMYVAPHICTTTECECTFTFGVTTAIILTLYLILTIKK